MNGKQETTIQVGGKRNVLQISFLIGLIGVLILVITLFLPFASATGDYREFLKEYADEMYMDEINMKNGQAVNISLFEFGRIYAAASGSGSGTATACLVVIVAFALFAVLTTLFTVLKKPVAMLIFGLISLGMFQIIRWDFEDRGVLPGSNYDWGIAAIACYIGVILVAAGAIWILVEKAKAKGKHEELTEE